MWFRRPPLPESENVLRVATGNREGMPSYFAMYPWWSWGRDSRREMKQWHLEGYVLEYSAVDLSRPNQDYSDFIDDRFIDVDELAQWERDCSLRYVEGPAEIEKILREYFSHLLRDRNDASQNPRKSELRRGAVS